MRHGLHIVLAALLLCGAAAAQKKAAPAPPKPQLDCAGCHSEASLAKEVGGKVVSLHVDPKAFQASVHSFLSCNDCHADIQDFPHQPVAKVACGNCHAEAQAKYDKGIHARSLQQNHGSKAAGCLDCHGGNGHAILASSDPKSATYRSNLPQTCGRCHGVAMVMESGGRSAQPFLSYEQSVHGKAVHDGSQRAAICTDCHGSHEILLAGEPSSSIFKFNVPRTCGACHENITRQYTDSIHGQAIARGNWQAPICTDCHGIHAIKAHIDPASSVAARNLARSTCAQCHEGVRLSQEFGIPSRRTTTYMDSYHGAASSLGSKVVANCASCHGVHNIFASKDPRSTIHKANLVATCGTCHPGATQNFSTTKVHLDAPTSRDIGSLGTMWVRRFYLTMIAVVIGAMLVHNGIIFRRKLLARRNAVPRTVERMSPLQRAQHFVLMASFIFLAVSGFALKYPDSVFALVLGYSESVRRIGHRIAGVLLIAVGAYHLWYLARTREGRSLFRDFLPSWQDVRDLRETLLYYLGRSEAKPRFGRFNYADKAEYYALVWGTILMGVTGLMLWFNVETGWLVPRWVLDIANALHFWEAVLAVLAIIVWHLYFVVFDPDVYPLNWAFWDGRISEHHLHEHHARMVEPAAPPEPPPDDAAAGPPEKS